LDGGANVGHAHIDTGFPDTSVRCILDSGEQVVVGGVEGHGEGTVDDATVDVSTEIDLHDVSLLENCLVTSIGGVVGSAVVDAQTSRETHASSDVVALFKTLMAGQVAHAILDTLSNLSQGLSRLDSLLMRSRCLFSSSVVRYELSSMYSQISPSGNAPLGKSCAMGTRGGLVWPFAVPLPAFFFFLGFLFFFFFAAPSSAPSLAPSASSPSSSESSAWPSARFSASAAAPSGRLPLDSSTRYDILYTEYRDQKE
ncbi:peptidase M24A, methionine aminopeptidase, partial [Aureobasidium melanogenum]